MRMRHIQIIDNNAIHDRALPKYPNLHREVMAHDNVTKSSWYTLTEIAFKEFEQFRQMMLKKKLWVKRDAQ